MVLFSWPTSGNISWPFMVVTVVALVIYYFASARRTFKGPRSMGGSAELTEIEREFEHAAEELGGHPPDRPRTRYTGRSARADRPALPIRRASKREPA